MNKKVIFGYRDDLNLARVPLPSGFLHVEKTKIMLGVVEKLLIKRLRAAFENFFFTIPEWAFFFASTTPKHIYLGYIVYNKNSLAL
jgi:hypothetical protein